MSTQVPARGPSAARTALRAGDADRDPEGQSAGGQSADPEGQPADDGREESKLERLDRNTAEMVQEMRVGAVGILVLIAHVVFGGTTAAAAGALAAIVLGWLWFGCRWSG